MSYSSNLIPSSGENRFDITSEEDLQHGIPKQQVHIALGPNLDPQSSRHPCFRLGSPEALLELQRRIYDHYARGGASAPRAADKPGESSGEYQFLEPLFFTNLLGNSLDV